MGCSLDKSVAEELIVAYAARRLSADAQIEFERHLETCAGCREQAARQGAVWSLLEEWHPLPVSPDFEQKVARRVAQAGRNGWWHGRLGSWSRRPLISVAAACAVLLLAFLLKENDHAHAPGPANQPQLRIEQQVEHALDDMDMLKQIDVDASSAKPGPARKI